MDRKVAIKKLKQETFDVLIVGAGINGAVSAASLSHHGYRVALIDQGDFACETSQASSNLIWGGIKYMENYEFSLVAELCRSRNRLMKAFPSLIREIRFFLPLVSVPDTPSRRRGWKGNWKHHWFFLYAGMWLYWLLGRFHTRPPKFFTTDNFDRTRYPLNRPLFRRALEYSDAYLPENDARLIYRFIRQAESKGAVVSNYVKLKGWGRGQGETVTVDVEDRVGKRTLAVKTRFLINAAGPFIDGINHHLNINTQYRHVLSKGVHLIFPRVFPDEKVISFFDEDDRLFFAIPMNNRTVVGTTDNRVEKPKEKVTEADREFLLRNINRFLDPEHRLTKKDIIAERCGVRPLVVKSVMESAMKSDVDSSKDSDQDNWFQLSRKHSLEVGRRILFIFGGKLTDCINIGEEVTEKIGEYLPPSENPVSSSENWYGEESPAIKKQYDATAKEYLGQFPEIKKFLPLWWTRYGSDAEKILSLLKQRKQKPQQERITEILGSGYTDVEIIHIVQNEQVVDREDLLRRRTQLQLIIKKNELLKHPVIKKIIREYRL